MNRSTISRVAYKLNYILCNLLRSDFKLQNYLWFENHRFVKYSKRIYFLLPKAFTLSLSKYQVLL